jgi:hypothetical protein
MLIFRTESSSWQEFEQHFSFVLHIVKFSKEIDEVGCLYKV